MLIDHVKKHGKNIDKKPSTKWLRCKKCNKGLLFIDITIFRTFQILLFCTAIFVQNMLYLFLSMKHVEEFTREDSLKRHMLIHDKSKRIDCPFSKILKCKVKFYRMDELKQHLGLNWLIQRCMLQILEMLYLREEVDNRLKV